MTDILIIPDIHGRTFWKEPCSNWKGKIVFLGDYLDPYSDENISFEDALNNFKDIIQFAKNNSDCILLIGNHDLGYIFPNNYNCTQISRHQTHAEATKLFNENSSLFKVFYKINSYIFSHAGIQEQWLKFNQLELNHLDTNILDINPDILSQCPFSRGGWNQYGSCVWEDARFFDPGNIKEYQIFGHTQLLNAFITNKWACLDCRKAFILKDNKITEFKNN